MNKGYLRILRGLNALGVKNVVTVAAKSRVSFHRYESVFALLYR
ncbi:hypothetical protein Mc24_05010 [Thermotoga sp. Mc24]|nr:hypothetical protein Mc24_05010 [Thermotoga sp. Mc24]